jgi:hypothetical protein
MKEKLTVKDLAFVTGQERVRAFPCGTCGKKTHHIRLTVEMELPLKETAYGIDGLCPECLTSPPKVIAERARNRAASIEVQRPGQHEDADSNVRKAFDLRRMANILDTVESIDDIDGGILARKIGEAFVEMDRPKAPGKAA